MSDEHKNSGKHSRADLLGYPAEGMTYAGELSFLRRKYTKEIKGADWVVTGIPFDSATTFRPGARFGPQAIRAGSVQLAEIAERAFPFGIDLFGALAVADYGDCELPSGYPQNVVERVEAHARDIISQGPKLMSLGGDHFVTYPLLRAHAEKYGPLSLIHFDAHVDTWEDDGLELNHGSMFLRALREGIIVPERSVQIGIRSFSAEGYGFVVLDAPFVHDHGTGAVIEKLLETVSDHAAYLSFDIDCLDPAFAPGTGTPVAGGLSSAQALSIIRGLGSVNLVGMDVVEVAPAYDHAEITAIAAANIAHDVLCLQALKKT